MGAPEEFIETWALYTAGSLVILSRIGCRYRMIGFGGFRPDDYIIFFSWVINIRSILTRECRVCVLIIHQAVYTTMTVAAHIVGGVGDLHALPLEVRQKMSEDESKPYVYGAQWFCAGVATYNLFIWTLKLNMLFLYQRIVKGLWVEKLIKPAMAIVFFTFVAVMLVIFCACRPYNRMWIVYPDQGSKFFFHFFERLCIIIFIHFPGICQPQSTINMVPPLIMNILTDLMIMAIPAPVLINLKTTLWKKAGLLLLFGAGFFIMIAAILRVTMVLVVGWHSYI